MTTRVILADGTVAHLEVFPRKGQRRYSTRRETCPRCSRDVLVNVGGELRAHRDRQGLDCRP